MNYSALLSLLLILATSFSAPAGAAVAVMQVDDYCDVIAADDDNKTDDDKKPEDDEEPECD